MRQTFLTDNFSEKEVVLNIRVPKDAGESLEHAIDEAFANVLYDLGCELVDSKEYRDVTVPDLRSVDLDCLIFRDYDDTGIPDQFFFGYNETKEKIQSLASEWGYKGDLCNDITICLDLYSAEMCPVEAVLTFTDGEQRWVDLRSNGEHLEKLGQIISLCETEAAHKALRLFKEISGPEDLQPPKDTLSSQIGSASARLKSAQDSPAGQTKNHQPER